MKKKSGFHRVGAVLACLALGSSALVAGTTVAQAETVAPEVNDCLTIEKGKEFEFDAPVTVVDCAESHVAEVFAVVGYPEDAGAPSTITDRAWELFGGDCSQGGMFAWLGAPTKTRLPLRVYTSPRMPTDEEWEAGARWVACIATRPNAQGGPAIMKGTLPELFAKTPLQDWVNCLSGAPQSGKWAKWAPCTAKSKWLVVEGIMVKGKITADYPKDLQAKADALCVKQAKPFLKKGAKTKPVAGLGPKKDFPNGDPFGDCFIAFADWNGKTG